MIQRCCRTRSHRCLVFVCGPPGLDARLTLPLPSLALCASGAVFAVAVSPDGRTALSGSQDDTAVLFNLEDGQIIHTFKSGLSQAREVVEKERTRGGGQEKGKTKKRDNTRWLSPLMYSCLTSRASAHCVFFPAPAAPALIQITATASLKPPFLGTDPTLPSGAWTAQSRTCGGTRRGRDSMACKATGRMKSSATKRSACGPVLLMTCSAL